MKTYTVTNRGSWVGFMLNLGIIEMENISYHVSIASCTLWDRCISKYKVNHPPRKPLFILRYQQGFLRDFRGGKIYASQTA